MVRIQPPQPINRGIIEFMTGTTESIDEVKAWPQEALGERRRALLDRAGRLTAADLRAMAILTRCATNVENLMSEDQITLADGFLTRLGL